MLEFIIELADLFINLWTAKVTGKIPRRTAGKKTADRNAGVKRYSSDTQKPVLKCSICNGEQVAGFKDIRTGKFEEAAFIRNEKELDDFMKAYGISEIEKEY